MRVLRKCFCTTGARLFWISFVFEALLIFVVTTLILTLEYSSTNRKIENYTLGPFTEDLYNPGFTYSNSKMCPNKGKGIKLFIMIISNPKHISDRIAIRKTWVKQSDIPEVALAFLVGETRNATIENLLQAENKIYDDIIRSKNIDTYNNLTLKSLSMLEWINTYCYNASYLMKTDDDMFIDISKLLKQIQIDKIDTKKRTIFGTAFYKNFGPIRDKNYATYVSYEEYFPKTYPPYVNGPAYIIPLSLTKEMFDYSLKLRFLKLEDVFITGFVAGGLRIKLKNFRGFSTHRFPSSLCWTRRVICANLDKQQFYAAYYIVNNPKFKCSVKLNKTVYKRSKKKVFKGQVAVAKLFKPYF